MSGFFAFDLDQPGLAGVRFLLRRAGLPPVGDPESDFFDAIATVERHPAEHGIGRVLERALTRADTEIVVIIRNPHLVLDAGLARRIAASAAVLRGGDDWSIAGPGGLGLDGRRHLALYASDTPAIPDRDGPQPLIDLLPDLYLVNAGFARGVLAGAPALPDAALEPILSIEGYLNGRAALFLPELIAGILGQLVSRNVTQLSAELATHFGARQAGQSIPTLSGLIELPEAAGAAAADRLDPAARDLDDVIRSEIARRCARLSLSIVVRTRFKREHLLRRLLTSLCRARDDAVELEVVLSSDADPELCKRHFAELQREFGALALRLQQNAPGTHSRVVNLLGGVRAARHDYVALIDDDDYVDLFAFEAIARTRFGGNRPLIVAGSEVHNETWERTPSGRWVLSQSTPASRYPASGWREMFGGVNRLPVCALIMPCDRLIARLDHFELAHDLSEDYALFLLLLTDPELPPIHEVAETFCHISLRGAENSVTSEDRRPWVRDIAAYLSDLTGDRRVAPPGLWALLAPPGATPAAVLDRRALDDTTAALARADEDARLMRREIAQLRRELSHLREGAA